MKQLLTFLAALLLLAGCKADYSNPIIPQPREIVLTKGLCPATAVPIIDTIGNETMPAEGYRMDINPEGIAIEATDGAGAFYALQSLDFLKRAFPKGIPCQKIYDYPRFSYRGVHLDVSRHFRDKEFIKKQLLLLSRLKINRFHFHLTDAAGWRLQIDSYPKLYQQAAWRSDTLYLNWRRGGSTYCTEDYPGAYGGYYTKDDIREIVAFADSLHITVVPEIEMFGHSKEVVAAYPATGCGKDHLIINEDGTVSSTCSNLCIGSEETFKMLEAILDEVMELFPSEYIHIGGDEASKRQWRSCPACQKRIAAEHLDGEDGLQSYGIERIEKFVNSRGRQIIGWDEILEGGLAPNAAVMSWRGEEGGRKAAAAGHHVVMTPGVYCYLDKVQDDPSTEPAGFGGFLSIEKLYSYDPAPLDMEGREFVSGVQTNLWTEMVPTAEHAEHMLYPRVYALAEIAWTETEQKDFDDFRQRALLFNSEVMSMGYHPFDLSNEKRQRQGYDNPIKHKAVGCKVSYDYPYSPKYPADGDSSMTDGLIGGWDYRDRWMGWIDDDATFTVDLGKVCKIKELTVNFGQWMSSDIVMPESVTYEISTDGENFTTLADVDNTVSREERRPVFQPYTWKGDSKVKTRFIRVTGHLDENKWGWLFADELIVR